MIFLKPFKNFLSGHLLEFFFWAPPGIFFLGTSWNLFSGPFQAFSTANYGLATKSAIRLLTTNGPVNSRDGRCIAWTLSQGCGAGAGAKNF